MPRIRYPIPISIGQGEGELSTPLEQDRAPWETT